MSTATNPPPPGTEPPAPPPTGQEHPDHRPAVVKAALGVAGGSAAGLAGILMAAGQAAINTATACFAIAIFAVIMLSALGVAAAYALRQQ